MTRRFICYFMTFLVGTTCARVTFASDALELVANVGNAVANAANALTNTANATTNTATVQPATNTTQTTTQTNTMPSMLSVNDEYTDIVKRIDAEMDVIMAECSTLGLKKPEFLTGTEQQNTNAGTNGPSSSGGGDSSSSGGQTPGGDSTTNNDEIVFYL